MYRGEQSKHWSPEWDAMVINYVFASKRKSHHPATFKKVAGKHLHEKQAEDLDESSIRGFCGSVNPIADKVQFRPPIYPVAWGWNAGGRSGNTTAFELREPRLTIKSGMRQYISAATGTHHSLLVSSENIVYSFGDGRYGQLGYGNDYMDQPGVQRPKGGFVQSCPRAVTPSGLIQFGHDLKISQVACGTSFSFAREMTTSEGASMIKGLMESEKALLEMKRVYFDSDKLQQAWCHVRQERYRANRVSEGRLLSWGTGKHGELGINQYVQFCPRPRVIPRLRHINITQIAAGKTHVLAVSSAGFIYSWGSGKAGKLGHGDFEDRFTPLMIKFFESFYIENCAAGDAHSAVLTTIRKGAREAQLKRVSTFGRGAHGRLGNGNNKSTHTPVPVSIWPPSVEGAQFISIACGGAHTAVLATITRPATKALPWGFQTVVLTWGFGANGQLGTGYNTEDSFVPVRSRLGKSVIIAEVTAGKSWTMARSVGGELYTWGKGLRGQLGQGKTKFSFAPRKLKTFASFVQISSGCAHNVCLSAPKKHFNPKVALAFAGSVKAPSAPIVPIASKQMESESVFGFDCCRRHLNSSKSRQRFICKTCDITCICYVCAKQCHANHDLVERLAIAKKVVKSINPLKKKRLAKKSGKKEKLDQKKVLRLKKKTEAAGLEEEGKTTFGKRMYNKKGKKAKTPEAVTVKVPFCRCGMFNKKCRLIPVIPEGNEEMGDEFIVEAELVFDRRRRISAVRIQRLARTYIERQHIKLLKIEAAEVRLEVCTGYWHSRVLKQIWTRLERSRQKFREEREMEEMFIEDATRKRFDYFYCLQTAVGGMDAILHGTKALLGAASVSVPRVLRKITTDEFRPSFAFTWSSVRQLQLDMHPHRRVSPGVLAELTRNFARFDKHEDHGPDPDVSTIFKRFMRDTKTEKFRNEREKFLEEREKAKEMRAERARAAFIALKFAYKAVVAQAAAIIRPMPPSLPPPPHVLAAQAAAAKAERKQQEASALRQFQLAEDAPFDMFSKLKRPRVYRRNSIAAPEMLYRRLVQVQSQLPLRTFSRRRNSFPDNMKHCHPTELPTLPHVASIWQSLSLFTVRDEIFDRFLNPKNQKTIGSMSIKVRRRRISDVMGSAALNPRLPLEMNGMVLDGYRRRTVAEPERLSKQLHIMFETRNKWSELRDVLKEDEKMTFRRRSFDHGEIVDTSTGIIDTLGYDFEEPYRKPLIMEMRKDSGKMERAMIESGFLASSLPSFSSSKFGAFLKRNVEDEERLANKKDDSKSGKPGGQNKAGGNSRLSSIRVAGPSSQATAQHEEEYPDAFRIAEAQLWQEHFSETGETYYYCPSTGESSWNYPSGDIQLCNQYQDEGGNYYWYNSVTGDSWYE